MRQLTKRCKARPEVTRSDTCSRAAATSPGQQYHARLAPDLTYTSSRTPQRAAPNSGKKRRPLTHLSRSIATPGHGARMSAIFTDASATLQSLQLSPCSPSLNVARTGARRRALSQARRIGFGSAAYADDEISLGAQPQSPGGKNNSKLVSDGPLTPSLPYSLPYQTPEKISYPMFEVWQLPRSSSIASGVGSSCDGSQSSHSIFEATSLLNAGNRATQITNIDSWLANIPTPTGNELPSSPQFYHKEGGLVTRNGTRLLPTAAPNLSGQRPVDSSPSRSSQGIRPPSRTSSNKENLNYEKSSPSPRRSLIQHLSSTPSHLRNPKTQSWPQLVGALRSPDPSSTQGFLSLPPIRKRNRTAHQTTSFVEPATSAIKDFTIHEDRVVEALAELSPLVERHRKGRGPKRERCMSYFDEDIIEIGSPSRLTGNNRSGSLRKKKKGEQVLNESK